MRPSKRALSSAACLLIFAGPACGGGAEPTSRESVTRSKAALSTARAVTPRLVPNRVRYGTRGAEVATGRSGNATLTTRALLGRDRVTEIQASTGPLDAAGSSPGSITQLQIKAFRGGPAPSWTATSRVTGSQVREQAGGLVRGQALQLQANVEGVDPRTDVVTVDDVVKLRPDLEVTALAVPARIAVGSRVQVLSRVFERNGDVGATADCTLSVDGAVVDRAPGVWIGAGDRVVCAFTHTFAALGAHEVRLAVERVIPADWEDSNNAASATVTVVEPELGTYFADARETFVDRSVDERTWFADTSGTTRPDLQLVTEDHSVKGQRTLSWDLPVRSAAFPLTVSFHDETDGRPLSAVDDAFEAPDWTEGGVVGRDGSTMVTLRACARREYEWEDLFGVPDPNVDLEVCVSPDKVTLRVRALEGSIFYYASTYCSAWAQAYAGCREGFYVDRREAAWGPRQRLGRGYASHAALDIGGATYRLDPAVPSLVGDYLLGPASSDTCETTGGVRTCSRSSFSWFVRGGATMSALPSR